MDFLNPLVLMTELHYTFFAWFLVGGTILMFMAAGDHMKTPRNRWHTTKALFVFTGLYGVILFWILVGLWYIFKGIGRGCGYVLELLGDLFDGL